MLCLIFFVVIIGLVILDISKKIFSKSVIVCLFLVLIPHIFLVFTLLGEYFFIKELDVFSKGIIYALLILLHIYFWVRIVVFPIFLEKDMGIRINIIYGGRRTLYYGLFALLAQIPIYVFLPQLQGLTPQLDEVTTFVLITDAVLTGIYIFNLIFIGATRIFCASNRLGLVRRLVILGLMWVPIVNIFVMLYLCHIANIEYDHQVNMVENRKASADTNVCKTKYPIILLHGVGFRDFKYVNYWGRIPKELAHNGATIYYGNQEAWGTVSSNANDVKKRIQEVMSEQGCQKINLVAHSKGGLDARYAISKLGIGDYVASLTTISTPHRGCLMVDYACKLPDKIYRGVAKAFDKYYTIIGDKNPDFYTASRQFSVEYSQKFNEEVIDHKGVYYQSYMSVMKSAFSDLLLSIPFIIIKKLEGDNDGLVSIGSSKWGEFKGLFKNKYRRGISHGDVIDLRRDDYKGYNAMESFVEIISDLRKQGF